MRIALGCDAKRTEKEKNRNGEGIDKRVMQRGERWMCEIKELLRNTIRELL